ncbi:hypothetical protein J2045_000695 [Peteryoungia aggregata LMG 23059]|uniref:Uncharacterized protein n=1 Tax=Peteryoungia aggregata LMG 23059 TaxID=1368425 RepID=A0ABU0G2Z7_9HYPH|nr:hypothetical protein [Peteryoungia aggregata]MDQ0419682.1 hypothetical protein [Peteryoungia aggregata LMG 23059]
MSRDGRLVYKLFDQQKITWLVAGSQNVEGQVSGLLAARMLKTPERAEEAFSLRLLAPDP